MVCIPDQSSDKPTSCFEERDDGRRGANAETRRSRCEGKPKGNWFVGRGRPIPRRLVEPGKGCDDISEDSANSKATSVDGFSTGMEDEAFR
jgi:hypothetical protein